MNAFFSLIFWVCIGLLGWTYFGYPLLMFAWSKLRPRPIKINSSLMRDGTNLPSITLLIPAYNEADVIRRKLTNSVELNYPKDKLQILVVDDGSDDGTADIVREFTSRGVTLIQQPQRGGKVAGINRGMEQATGEIVVLSDASPNYERDSLPLLVRNFTDPEVGLVVGRLELWDAENAVVKPAGLYWRYEAALRKWEAATGSTVAVHGNMFAFRRSLYKPLQVGTVNDEFSIAMEIIRQGYRVVYETEAVSYDEASSRMGDEFKRRARINAGRYQALFSAGYLNAPNIGITFRLFSHKLLRPLSPMLMLAALITNAFAVLFAKDVPMISILPLSWLVAWLLLLGQVGFYALAALGWQLEKVGRSNKLLNVPYFFVNGNLSALVGFWRWVSGTQRVTWQKRTAQQATVQPIVATTDVVTPDLVNTGVSRESR